MTTTPPLPRTLPAWIKALDDAPLPAFAAVHGKVRLALRDASKSMRQIAELIQDSPVLALRFIQEANRGIGDGQPAESLEVALSRIGLQRAEALLARIPAMEAQDMPRPLRQVVLISRHASQQANGLFAARLARLWQDIHWGSLLFLAPAWALVGAYPHLLDAWEQRVLVKGEPASRVERELLGVSLLELCLALAEHWRLPDWIIQGYRLLGADRRRLIKALHIAHDNEHPLHQQQMLDADPELRRWLTLPSNTNRTGQRPGAVGAPQLERHPQPALATPGRAVSAGPAGGIAADGAPAGSHQRPRFRRDRSLAPRPRVAVAEWQPLPGVARSTRGHICTDGRSDRMARTLPPPACRTQPVQQRAAADRHRQPGPD